MAVANAAQSPSKTVASPSAAYESLKPVWDRCRAVCNGERAVKDYDGIIDTALFSNLLIPFSPSMTQAQFNFYKAEAEIPGITAQFAKMLVGGLLRKKPSLQLPDGAPDGAVEWLINQFGQDDASLTAFLDAALWEEMQTSRAWVYVDHPSVEDANELTPEERAALKPYPVLWDADYVINTRTRKSGHGKDILDRVIVSGLEESYDANEFHPEFLPTVWVHELDEEGLYQIRKFQRDSTTAVVTVSSGHMDKQAGARNGAFTQVGEPITDILANGERLKFIPAWPLNGSIEPQTPVLASIIDKEIALYNKVSRRNHLLYGAATYTPIISSNMGDEEFDEIVGKGLGSWIRLRQDDTATVLATPTEALQDMDRAIAASIDEMAKLGIRMLSPDTAQSGVALQLRNAAQTAQLGTLNSKVSSTLQQIMAFMLNWRYDLDYKAEDVIFSLSADFNPTPLGADWLRLATEWYQGGLIPRNIWLAILKQNDLLDPSYDDEAGKKEIIEDMDMLSAQSNDAYAEQIKMQQELQAPAAVAGVPQE